MLEHWDDINKITRTAFGDEEAPLPPGMFGNIQKKLFWSNAILFAKAYLKVITISASGIAVVAALLCYFMISKNHNIKQESAKTSYTGVSLNLSNPVSENHFTNTDKGIYKTENHFTANKPAPEKQRNIFKLQNTNGQEETKNVEVNPTVSFVNRPMDFAPVQHQKTETMNFNESRTPVYLLQKNSIQSNNEYMFQSPVPLMTECYSKRIVSGLTVKIYGGPVFSAGSRKYIPEINNPEVPPLRLNSSVTAGVSAGVAACLGVKHWRFQFGLQFTSLKMNYSETGLLYNSHVDTFTFISGYHEQVYRHNYYHLTYRLDSIIHTVDSVYTTEYDTAYLPVYEQGRKISTDTVKQLKWKESFFILEFPVTVGYSATFNNFELGLNCGLILGYIAGSRYKTYSGSEGQEPLTATGGYYNYKSLQLSGVASLSVTYWAGRHTGIELVPFYRKSLLNIYSYDKKSKLGYQQFGVHLGIIYKF